MHDLAVSHYIDVAQKILGDPSVLEQFGPNEAVSFFNILRYADSGMASAWDKSALNRVRMALGKFGLQFKPDNLAQIYGDLKREELRDFWEMFVHFRWYEKYSSDKFGAFLATVKPAIRAMLGQTRLLKIYPDHMKAYFLLNPENATIILESKSVSVSQSESRRSYLPENLSNVEIDTLFSKYMDLSTCAYGYLEIIANIQEVSDRTKLKARRKAKEMSAALFSESRGITFGIEIQYVQQQEAATLQIDDRVFKYCYDLEWVTKELDPPTILNNYIYLFEFIDQSGRITLVSTKSEISVAERLFTTERLDWYPAGMLFSQKNQTALMQLYSYYRILESVDVRLEKVVEWYFSDYLKSEHGVSDFRVDLPGVTTSYLEKCRIIAPEIERILKQYTVYCEDHAIDQELLAIGSRSMPVAECPSLVQKKYAYQNSDNIQRAIYYFFSDQCMLLYDSTTQKPFDNFYTRINEERVHQSKVDDYLSRDLDWLIDHQYLVRDSDGWLAIADVFRIRVIRELYYNEVVPYWKSGPQLRAAIDTMAASGDLRFESRLFSIPEKDYMNFHMNKVQFINSLDLRNRHAHGSGPRVPENEDSLRQDYFMLLKIVILVVLKINDDFEQNDLALKVAET